MFLLVLFLILAVLGVVFAALSFSEKAGNWTLSAALLCVALAVVIVGSVNFKAFGV